MMNRKAVISRETKETSVSVELNIDGSGQFEARTGIRMFDHLLAQLAQHGLFDLAVSATGNNQHHLVEDVGICLGKAFNQALEERQGITRMAHAMVPMDETLALAAVDISGRGYTVVEAPFSTENIAGLASDLIRHFLESFASEARLNLHAKVLTGTNDHHKAEALFKALARALDTATRIDEQIAGKVPSTKDFIESD
ncbi:imidazoleglycerol-phosphate dehydratase HisB [Chloroflexota bacterium]